MIKKYLINLKWLNFNTMKYLKLLIVTFPFILISCSKGGDSTTLTPTPTPTEIPVAFTVNVDPGAGNILAVVGTAQIINVKVSSTIPAAGVSILVTVNKDADNSQVFTASNSSVSSDNNITINGLTPGVLCTATVVVTSKATSTNNKTVNFKLVAK